MARCLGEVDAKRANMAGEGEAERDWGARDEGCRRRGGLHGGEGVSVSAGVHCASVVGSTGHYPH